MIPKKGIPASLQKTFALICFTVFFLLNASLSSAQTLTFLGGISLPSGLYASKDFTKASEIGLALPGYNFSLIFDDNRKGKIISPFIQYTFNSNKMDGEAFEKFEKAYSSNCKGLQASKPWNQSLIMIGPRLNFYGDNFDMFVKGSLGIGWLASYEYNIYYDTIMQYTGVNAMTKNIRLKANVLVFSFGLGTDIHVNQSVSACLGYEFFYARPEYGFEKLANRFGTVILTGQTKFAPPFQTSVFYAGLRFHLKRNLKKN